MNDQRTTMEKTMRNDNKSLKDGNNGGRGRSRSATNDGCNNSWGNNINVNDQDSLLGDGGDLLGGFSWPPRSYTCTFCKREFRSAQALGGHMNVHRRDRARLRQIPSSSRDLSQNFSSSYNYSLLNLNPDPNPNPNPNFSTYFSSNLSPTPTMFPSFTSKSKSMLSSPLISPYPSSLQPNLPCVSSSSYRLRPMMKSQIPSFGVLKYDGFLNENENKMVKKSEIIRLNLEIGLLGESKSDDLDLELRLGVS